MISRLLIGTLLAIGRSRHPDKIRGIEKAYLMAQEMCKILGLVLSISLPISMLSAQEIREDYRNTMWQWSSGAKQKTLWIYRDLSWKMEVKDPSNQSGILVRSMRPGFDAPSGVKHYHGAEIEVEQKGETYYLHLRNLPKPITLSFRLHVEGKDVSLIGIKEQKGRDLQFLGKAEERGLQEIHQAKGGYLKLQEGNLGYEHKNDGLIIAVEEGADFKKEISHRARLYYRTTAKHSTYYQSKFDNVEFYLERGRFQKGVVIAVHNGHERFVGEVSMEEHHRLEMDDSLFRTYGVKLYSDISFDVKNRILGTTPRSFKLTLPDISKPLVQNEPEGSRHEIEERLSKMSPQQRAKCYSELQMIASQKGRSHS